MFDREILRLFVGNGIQHILVSKGKAIECPSCGTEVQGTTFYSIDGKIIKVSENLVVIERVDGQIKTVRSETIVSIDTFDLSIAKTKQKEWVQ
jgi:hypothetical protein